MWSYNHSGIVENNDDYLMHWKYVKRVRKNGKWRYYYDIGQNQKKAMNKAAENEKQAKSEVADAIEDANLVKLAYEKSNLSKIDSVPMPEMMKKLYEPVKQKYEQKEQQAEKEVQAAKEKYIEAGKAYMDAQKAYYKTPLGKIDKVVQKGKSFLKRLFK